LSIRTEPQLGWPGFGGWDAEAVVAAAWAACAPATGYCTFDSLPFHYSEPGKVLDGDDRVPVWSEDGTNDTTQSDRRPLCWQERLSRHERSCWHERPCWHERLGKW